MKAMRTIIITVGVILLTIGLYYLMFWRHINAGSLMMTAFGIMLTLTGVFYLKMGENGFLKFLRGFVVFGTCACFLAAVTISFMMIRCLKAAPSDDIKESNPTVIVLGCQIRGDRPSYILAKRLDAAYEFLSGHSESAVIVSGGQGDDEEVSEAYVMANYLISKGISQDRIILEEKSVSTCTNLEYSSIIIEQNGLSKDVLIATDGYHQLRAHTYAKQFGLTPYSLPSKTLLSLLPEYWVREILGILYIMFIE